MHVFSILRVFYQLTDIPHGLELIPAPTIGCKDSGFPISLRIPFWQGPGVYKVPLYRLENCLQPSTMHHEL